MPEFINNSDYYFSHFVITNEDIHPSLSESEFIEKSNEIKVSWKHHNFFSIIDINNVLNFSYTPE